MVAWTRQGQAWTATVRLTGNESAKAVLVAGRENPKGAVVVVPDGKGGVAAQPLKHCIDRILLPDLVAVLCMQERAFGTSGLPSPA